MKCPAVWEEVDEEGECATATTEKPASDNIYVRVQSYTCVFTIEN